MTVSVVGFDADDTLWHSEPFFVDVEERFCEVMAPWATPEMVSAQLLKCEEENLTFYGYGVKGYLLSMVEVALQLSDGKISGEALNKILLWAKDLHTHPVDLLPGVKETVAHLEGDFRLLLITKGDLLHQSEKIEASGLADHFEASKILTHKTPEQYQELLAELSVGVDDFLMVGNSMRSDILPILKIGARAVHIPHEQTWGHELVEVHPSKFDVDQLDNVTELPGYIENL